MGGRAVLVLLITVITVIPSRSLMFLRPREGVFRRKNDARIEHQTPSLIDADSPERLTSWGSVLEGLRIMKERGVPDSMRDEN